MVQNLHPLPWTHGRIGTRSSGPFRDRLPRRITRTSSRFAARLRQECLNAHWFESIEEARSKIRAWQNQYNEEHPHAEWYRNGEQPKLRSTHIESGSTIGGRANDIMVACFGSYGKNPRSYWIERGFYNLEPVYRPISYQTTLVTKKCIKTPSITAFTQRFT
jgi:hypothetical protein